LIEWRQLESSKIEYDGGKGKNLPLMILQKIHEAILFAIEFAVNGESRTVCAAAVLSQLLSLLGASSGEEGPSDVLAVLAPTVSSRRSGSRPTHWSGVGTEGISKR